jgi:glyoxylase-like metal-dependent hydrolase (beta-lactamase superfamily II)
VPKVLWERVVGAEVDDEERIAMASIALVVETPDAVVVIDPGPGRTARAEVPAIVDLEASGLGELEAFLRALDAPRAEGSFDIVLTDLRAEHVGTLSDEGSPLRRAASRFVAQVAEWDAALRENDRVALMVDQASVRALAADRRAVRVAGEATVAPKVYLVATGGYTTGHQSVVVRGLGDGARTLAFFGDLLPRRWAANPRWITAFDDLPLEAVAAKADLFSQAAREGWLVVPSHEPGAPVGRLIADRDRFRFEPV